MFQTIETISMRNVGGLPFWSGSLRSARTVPFWCPSPLGVLSHTGAENDDWIR